MRNWNLNSVCRLPWLWKLSDLTMLTLACVLAFNALVSLLFLSRRALEQKMKMYHIDRLLKAVLVYSLFLLPVITGLNLFFQTYKKIWMPGGGDSFGYGMVIGNKSISIGTDYGNHWGFIFLFTVWLLGITYFGLRYLLKDLLFLKKLEGFNEASIDMELQGLMDELRCELKIKSSVKLGINSMISEPFVTGFWHPKLFFPAREMEKSARKLMLKHELVHCRCRDYFYRRLMCFMCMFYWYNPVIYRFADYFVEVNEMAGDEKVLEGASALERYHYAVLLAGTGRDSQPLSSAASLTGHTGNELVRRIEYISKMKDRPARLLSGILMAAVFLCCFLTTFAVSSGVSKAQDILLDIVMEEPKAAAPEVMIIQQTQPVPLLPLARAAMQIADWTEDLTDITRNGKHALRIGTYILPGGGIVHFWRLDENNETESPASSVSSSGGRTYITSADGLMRYSFPTPKAGIYMLFVEGDTTVTVPVFGYVPI